MMIWSILLVVAAILVIAAAWHNIDTGSREYERRRREDSARAWKEYHERLDSDLDWARNSAEKIQNEITQAELKLQDEQRGVFRGYTNPEMSEGSPQIASIAKKELVEASKPQRTASQTYGGPEYSGFDDPNRADVGYDGPEYDGFDQPEPFPLPPTPQKGEIVNRVIWDRDEQLEKEYKARAHAGKVQAVNPVQGFPHVVANLKDDHSGPFNDPKMSIHARQYQQRQLVV